MRILILAMCLAIAACDGGSGAAKEDSKEENKEGVFDPLVRSIDKANAVEQQVMDQKDRLDQAINESDGTATGDETDD